MPESTGKRSMPPALVAAHTGAHPDSSTARPSSTPSQMPSPAVTLIRRQPDDTLPPEHLALALGAVGIEEGAMNAGRLVADRIGHQRNDGADALMPAERVAQVIEQADMQAAPLDEIARAQRSCSGTDCFQSLKANSMRRSMSVSSCFGFVTSFRRCGSSVPQCSNQTLLLQSGFLLLPTRIRQSRSRRSRRAWSGRP